MKSRARLRRLVPVGLGVSLAALMTGGGPAIGRTPEQMPRVRGPALGAHAEKSARLAFLRTPLRFETFRGPDTAAVKFVARGAGHTTFFSSAKVVLALENQGRAAHEQEEAVVQMHFDGASPNPRVEGLGPQSAVTNYAMGTDPRAWKSDFSTFDRIRYREIYPGIDVVFHGKQRLLEYDFVVRPGANPADIAVRFDGGGKPRVDRAGNLIVPVGKKQIRQPKPVVFQEIRGVRRIIPGRYTVDAAGAVGFELGRYDRSKALIIDPVLSYSSYLGGDAADGALAVAVDAEGNIYVAGWTRSLNFPLESAAQPEYRGEFPMEMYCRDINKSIGCGDAFLTKIDPDRSKIIYSTYLGGTDADAIRGMAVDKTGNVYVAGTTRSVDFPNKGGLPDLVAHGSIVLHQKGFAAKIGPTGSVEYSTVLMGDGAYALALGPEGHMYVTGRGHTFEGLPRSFALGEGARDDPFVMRLNPSASGLDSVVYVTTFGGPGKDSGGAIAVDAQGAAYVAGSAEGGFPVTRHGFQKTLGGASDAFVVKVKPDGSALEYATYLGGPGVDSAQGIAVDEKGRTYVAGDTQSSGFPTRKGFKNSPVKGFKSDGFVTALDAKGAKLIYSTYLGAVNAQVHALAFGPSGSVIVAGNGGPGLATKRAPQARSAGKADAFLVKLDTGRDGQQSLQSATYLGGTESDSARALAVFPEGASGPSRIYVAGFTRSDDSFPASAAALQPTSPGDTDAFVAYLTDDRPAAGMATRQNQSKQIPIVTRLEPDSGPASGGRRVEIYGEHLDKVKSVSFGKVRVRGLLEKSARRLVVVAPAQAEGAVPVVVSSSEGRSPSSAFATFHYREGSWTSFPAPKVMNHTATLLADGKVLIAGGCSKGGRDGTCMGDSRSSYLFDPATRSWKATGKMVASGPHSALRLSDGKVLVTRSKSAEIYDPSTGQWKAAASPTRVLERVAKLPPITTYLPNGKVLSVERGSGRSLLYDPKADAWSLAGKDKSRGHGRSTAVLLKNGKVLTFDEIFPTEVYDPKTDEWLPAPDPQKRRSYHTATPLLDGRVLVTGGRDDTLGPTSETELYDPDAVADPQKPDNKGAWSPGRPMARPLYGHRAALLSDGNVLVVGGSREYGDRLATADIYDVKTGNWRPAGKMAVARGSAVPSPVGQSPPVTIDGTGGTSFTATALQDKSVLVVGGSTAKLDKGGTAALPSAELFSFSANAGTGDAGANADSRDGPLWSLIWLLLASLLVGAAAGLLAVRRNRRKAVP